jgi:hypothetical protein
VGGGEDSHGLGGKRYQNTSGVGTRPCGASQSSVLYGDRAEGSAGSTGVGSDPRSGITVPPPAISVSITSHKHCQSWHIPGRAESGWSNWAAGNGWTHPDLPEPDLEHLIQGPLGDTYEGSRVGAQ